MNTLKNVAILILLGALALAAQTPGSSVTMTSTTTCPTPGPGIFSLCKQTSGGPVTFTDEGSPYAKASLVATPGPQGVKGDTGLTGPQGPAGTLTGPICVTLTGDTKANLILTPVTCK